MYYEDGRSVSYCSESKESKETFMKKLFGLLLAIVTQVTVASTINFSFMDDSVPETFLGRVHVPGIVTGKIFGLNDNGSGQIPTSIEFTSDLTPLGITSKIAGNFTAQEGTGFTLVNGNVVAVNLLLNFDSLSSLKPMQIRFNYLDSTIPETVANVLHWNGGATPLVYQGNLHSGFAGATYFSSPVPLPAPVWLLGSALAGIIFRRRVT